MWLHARRLHDALAGHVLTHADLRVPRLATADLTGWTVREVVSRGKHLLIRVAATDGRRLTVHSHLRMDGTWRLFRPGQSWRGRPAHQIRAVLGTDHVTAVGFHLHDLALLPTADEADVVGHLGPDLLGPDWDPDEAVRRLAANPNRDIATALLDQRNLAGIGNVYKCELLFLRRVWPWSPVREVSDLPAMVALAKRLLELNKHRWPQITTGGMGRDDGTWVYGRAGKPCRRCGTPIRRSSHGGDVPAEDRVTYWCPRCQPEPAA